MIRIIKSIYVKEAIASPYEWMELPIVPASATIKKDVSHEDAGRLATFEIKASLFYRHKSIGHNLILKIIYEDGGCLNLGTIDLPVRLEYTNEQVLTISSKYKQRA